MDQNRLPDYQSVIKHQIASQEVLFEYHSKMEAMVEMLLAKDFADYPRAKLHEYLCILSDLIVEAKGLNEDLINRLIKTSSVLPISEPSLTEGAK